MPLSLTKEQFQERLVKNMELIKVAWEQKLCNEPQADIKIQINTPNEINISRLYNESTMSTVAAMIIQAIDFIYMEE